MSQRIKKIVHQARLASRQVAGLTTQTKNRLLRAMAQDLWRKRRQILLANARDMRKAQKSGLSTAMLDRLFLNEERLKQMIRGLLAVARLPDPVGKVVESRRHQGLTIKRVRIPLGVIGMIYESRPNVTVDAAALCLKSGNAVVLRGGSEAFCSSRILVSILASVLKRHGVDSHAISMVPDTDRQSMLVLMQCADDIDLLIPRGGESLMHFVTRHSKIPVIKHDRGVCSIFVDASARIDRALKVIGNAKTQRPGVCNALESLYVHQSVAKKFLPLLFRELSSSEVELRGDKQARRIVPLMKPATEKDFSTEYLDLILSVKIVRDVDDAIANIRRYYSRHTESILTENRAHADKFVRELDSSCVMVNTSTRFNDGSELGLGAEIGISTTKLHAYGPMGLVELTTPHFVVSSRYRTRK